MDFGMRESLFRFLYPSSTFPRIFIENHDHPRAVSRFGNDTTDELRALSAKMLAILEVTQKGTLYIYQGQELGLKNSRQAGSSRSTRMSLRRIIGTGIFLCIGGLV